MGVGEDPLEELVSKAEGAVEKPPLRVEPPLLSGWWSGILKIALEELKEHDDFHLIVTLLISRGIAWSGSPLCKVPWMR